MTQALNKIPGVNIQNPVGGSESIKSGLGYLGADPLDQSGRARRADGDPHCGRGEADTGGEG